MGKTIKQLADELGVSKTAIRKYMTPDFRTNYVEISENGTIFISEEGANLLQSLRKPSKSKVKTEQQTTENAEKFAETTTDQGGNQSLIDVLRATIDVLQGQLTAKDEQIRSLQSQIAQLTTSLENTTAALTASQALHAADKKTLMQIEEENSNRKLSFWERRAAKKASQNV